MYHDKFKWLKNIFLQLCLTHPAPDSNMCFLEIFISLGMLFLKYPHAWKHPDGNQSVAGGLATKYYKALC